MKATDLPLFYNAVDILERNLLHRADKVALYSRERNLTFQAISHEVKQVGNARKKLGVRMGDYVGILSLDCPEWVATFFGAVKIGAVAVGMNTLLTSDEYEYILRDSRARVVMVHAALLSTYEKIAAKSFVEHVIVFGDSGEYLSYSQWIAGESTELAVAPTHRDGTREAHATALRR